MALKAQVQKRKQFWNASRNVSPAVQNTLPTNHRLGWENQTAAPRRNARSHWAWAAVLVGFFAGAWLPPAAAQIRSQYRIATAERFVSPGTGRIAMHSIAGLTDREEVIGTLSYTMDEFDEGTTAMGWKWTTDGDFAFTPPSAELSSPKSLHDPTPYPFVVTNFQHGVRFYSAEPGGQRLASISDNRAPEPGFQGLLTKNPWSTHWSRRWSDSPGHWLPIANHPTSVSDRMEFDLESYEYLRIFPGGNVVGRAYRTPARVIDYSATQPYWRWQASGRRLVDFLLPLGGMRHYYDAPDGWPSDGLVESSVNRSGETVGLAMRLLPDNSNRREWKGLHWPTPSQPRDISTLIGFNAYPQHITADGEIVGVLPSNPGPAFHESGLREGRLFLWLPRAQWGLPAGLNWLTEPGVIASFVAMNDRGFLLYQIDSSASGTPAFYQWSSGSSRPWTFVSETWSNIVPTGFINNKGWVVAYGIRRDNAKLDYVLSYPLLDVDVIVEPKEVQLCDDFELVATVVSRSQLNLANFGPIAAPELAGDPNAALVSGPLPSAPQTLPAGGSLTYRWKCRATGLGEARFVVELTGTAPNGTVYRTLKITSDAVRITRPEIIVNTLGDAPAASDAERCGDIAPNTPGRQITLRSAIQMANALPGPDIIHFNLPVDSTRLVVLNSPLPPITEACDIRAHEQPGGGMVAIDASGAFGTQTGVPALEARADTTFRGLAFIGARNGNIALLLSRGRSTVHGCRFGVGFDGNASLENTFSIVVTADGQQIGGASADQGNLFGQGAISIVIGRLPDGANVVRQTLIEGNQFGLLDSGFAKLGPANGVFLINAAANRIGGAAPGARNQFRSIQGAAVLLAGPETTDNDIQGNWFGLTPAGEAVFERDALGYGICVVDGAHHNRLGGATAGARNVIASSETAGILVSRGAHHNTIEGNWIGLNGDGSASAPNQTGIWIVAGDHNRIGGPTPAQRNVISGNRGNGIVLGRPKDTHFKTAHEDPGAEFCRNATLEGNWIGLDASGTRAVPNGSVSYVRYQAVYIARFANGSIIGGATPGRANVISGNLAEGIRVDADPGTAHGIWGNQIGTSVDGLSPLPNANTGITVIGEPVVAIGGDAEFAPNHIAYNKESGIDLSQLKSNGPGLALAANRVHDNHASGSILLSRRRTPNDPGDTDSGPNGRQNWPLLVAAFNENGITQVVVDLSDCARGVPVRIDLFAASGGGGKTHIGSKSVTTGSDPRDRYLVPATLQFAGTAITALATTRDGTSEFAPPIAVVSGADSDGDGLPDDLERTIPISRRTQRTPSPSLGDRDGDGTPDAIQAHVASVPIPDPGDWLTVVSTSGRAVQDLIGLRASDVARLPETNRIAPGAVRFSIAGPPSTEAIELWLTPQPNPPSVWRWNDTSGWIRISNLEVSLHGDLWRLSFVLPPASPPGATLLAIGQPMQIPPRPEITLLPLAKQPLAQPVHKQPAGYSYSTAPTVLPPVAETQPVSIAFPRDEVRWTLDTSPDLVLWETVPVDPGAHSVLLRFPAVDQSRYFRWSAP